MIFCIKINIKGRKRLRFPFWMNVIRNNTHLIKMQDSLISAKVFFSHIWTLSYGRVGNPLFRCTFVDIAVSQSECRVLWSALSSELGNGSLFYIKISIKERKKWDSLFEYKLSGIATSYSDYKILQLTIPPELMARSFCFFHPSEHLRMKELDIPFLDYTFQGLI